ncbi:MAG: cytochrome-c oxidase, cbb3-type subunit III [Alphaproteobacteria bacterium]|nr:cytochrome-c oxidase, cbb3-type subunit III [Alphaproteobacteria bacterium]
MTKRHQNDEKTTKSQNNDKPFESFGVTGHSWDGVSEYNVPAPRWWLIVWIICIIWATIYWFFFPAWPTLSGNTKGSLNWTKYSELNKEQQEIEAKKSVYLEQMTNTPLNEIAKNEKLLQFALNTGRSAFRENCSACHGQGAQGAKGYPNLNDDDWLWGGKLDDIYQTLLYGIRANHELTRANQMPSFGLDKILKRNEINDTIEYVLSLSNKANYNANGEAIFKANCVACHGNEGKGNQALGAPNLTDAIWLYGSNKEDLFYTIYYSRAGVMPYWKDRIDNNTIKSLSIYVHSLGGGK